MYSIYSLLNEHNKKISTSKLKKKNWHNNHIPLYTVSTVKGKNFISFLFILF